MQSKRCPQCGREHQPPDGNNYCDECAAWLASRNLPSKLVHQQGRPVFSRNNEPDALVTEIAADYMRGTATWEDVIAAIALVVEAAHLRDWTGYKDRLVYLIAWSRGDGLDSLKERLDYEKSLRGRG
jgi:hypothetical protein